MKVFLSWSGERSKKMAEALRDWLPLMIHSVEAWMSAADIDSGARWASAIADQLEESKFGIVCLTSDNLTAPWLLFEAGALAKTKDASVGTFLLDISSGDVEGPLAQFQGRTRDRADVWKLIETIVAKCRAAGEKVPKDHEMVTLFDALWQRLDGALSAAANQPGGEARIERLDEILAAVLRLERQGAEQLRKDLRREKEVRRTALDAVHPGRTDTPR